MSADESQLEDIVGADLVYTVADPAKWSGGPDSGDGSAALQAHERHVLTLVDGRRTVAEILVLSPLGHPATLQHLRALYERGILLRSSSPEGPTRKRSPTGSNVIVIDTRHRDRTTAPRDAAPGTRSFSPADSNVGSTGTATGTSAPYRLGRYEIATRIGQGGMGSIYVCRVAGGEADRLHVLKVVRQYSDQQEVAAQSLLREGRIAGRLNHPNVQRVVDTGTYKGQPFLILDYIEGVSLTEILAGAPRAPTPVVVSILIDVLRGLEAAHNLTDGRGQPMGLVHGDVSPPNILVGVDGVARITDFGSCWIVSEDRAARANAAALGKPSYMAPEQLMAGPLDARTDLFALGAVMYLALTGQELFLADTYEEVVMNVLRKRIPAPSAFGSPSVLDDVCMRALSRAKEGRFASAAEMAHALFQAAAAEELVASPREVAEHLKREFGEIVAEQRLRIQTAFEGGAPPQSSGSWDLQGDSGAIHLPTPVQGVRSTETMGGGQHAVKVNAEGAPSAKPLAKTLFLPGISEPTSSKPLARTLFLPAADPAPEPPRARPPSDEQRTTGPVREREPSSEQETPPRRASGEHETARRASSELATLRRWLVSERRLILVAVACGLAMLIMVVALVRPSSQRPPSSAGATSSNQGP